jgi:hypothetical protein
VIYCWKAIFFLGSFCARFFPLSHHHVRFPPWPGIFFQLARCGYTLRVTSQTSYIRSVTWIYLVLKLIKQHFNERKLRNIYWKTLSCAFQRFVVNIVAPVKLLYELILLSRVDIITFISKPNINTYL